VPRRPLWVVKLGGSLAGWSDLKAWVRLLAAPRAVDLVVVPGGGPFADQVRAAQGCWRFSDRVAHRMAVLAMEQYGLMLCGLSRGRLAPAERPGSIRALLKRGKTPVWSPRTLVFADAEGARQIAETWDMTSDSLAAWLARRLGAQRLVLVKSARPPSRAHGLRALAKRGLLDAAFPRYATAGRFGVSVVWREDRTAMQYALRTGLPAVAMVEVQLPR
jgi:aspartokinase-like uncharacterized kinase